LDTVLTIRSNSLKRFRNISQWRRGSHALGGGARAVLFRQTEIFFPTNQKIFRKDRFLKEAKLLFGAIAIEPYDLVLVTKMNREWPDKITGERRQSFQNVYFRINVRCIKMKQPYFSPRMVTTPDSVRAHLTPVHKHFLTEFGIII
jgi:hypothetical protein